MSAGPLRLDVVLEVPDDQIRALADRAWDRVFAQMIEDAGIGEKTPWLSATEAAERLRCPVSRIRKLTMQGALDVRRDGARVLYRADDLDAFVEAGGATT